MADPIIDEEQMVRLLSIQVRPETAQALMTGAQMLVIDAFDRKITREEFFYVADCALHLYSYANKMVLLSSILNKSAANELDTALLTQAMEQLVECNAIYAAEANKYAQRLQECPVSTDKVH